MYNGIGLQTPRGSGTNGHVQRNFAMIRPKGREKTYKTEDDLAALDAASNRQPNKELLDHERKRRVEVKCAEFADLLESQGFSEQAIGNKVNNYRKLLLGQNNGQVEKPVDQWGRLHSNDTHQLAEAQLEKNARLREAFGISEYFVDGSSFDDNRQAKEQLAKSSALQAEEERRKAIELLEQEKQNEKQQPPVRYQLVETPSPEPVSDKKNKNKKKKQKKKRKHKDDEDSDVKKKKKKKKKSKKQKKEKSEKTKKKHSRKHRHSSDSDTSSDSSDDDSEDEKKQNRDKKKDKKKKASIKKRRATSEQSSRESSCERRRKPVSNREPVRHDRNRRHQSPVSSSKDVQKDKKLISSKHGDQCSETPPGRHYSRSSVRRRSRGSENTRFNRYYSSSHRGSCYEDVKRYARRSSRSRRSQSRSRRRQQWRSRSRSRDYRSRQQPQEYSSGHHSGRRNERDRSERREIRRRSVTPQKSSRVKVIDSNDSRGESQSKVCTDIVDKKSSEMNESQNDDKNDDGKLKNDKSIPEKQQISDCIEQQQQQQQQQPVEEESLTPKHAKTHVLDASQMKDGNCTTRMNEKKTGPSPVVRLRQSSSSDDDDEAHNIDSAPQFNVDNDSNEVCSKDANLDDKEMRLLRLLKYDLAAKAKESLQRKMPKSLVSPPEPVATIDSQSFDVKNLEEIKKLDRDEFNITNCEVLEATALPDANSKTNCNIDDNGNENDKKQRSRSKSSSSSSSSSSSASSAASTKSSKSHSSQSSRSSSNSSKSRSGSSSGSQRPSSNSKSRSGTSSRSRSPSIPRRHGSPSFLDRRRITRRK